MATALADRQYPAWFTSPERGCASPGEVQFFPPDHVDNRRHGFDSRPAKRLCRHCPFTANCLEWALKYRQEFGIWGGTDERQRRVIIRCRQGKCGIKCTHPYRQPRRTR